MFPGDGLDADLRLKEEHAVMKSMNEEQTASLTTALLHRVRDALAVRTQMRTAQRGLYFNPADTEGLEPPRVRHPRPHRLAPLMSK